MNQVGKLVQSHRHTRDRSLQRLLEESMESERPLVSPPELTSVLRDEYANSPNFLAQIDSLTHRGYRIIIRAKGWCCIFTCDTIRCLTVHIPL